MLSHLIRELLLPPSSLFLTLLLALALRRRAPRFSRGLVVATLVAAYLLSIPPVAYQLTRWTEKVPPVTPDQIAAFQPQAIVVLGGGAKAGAPEYEGATVPSLPTWPRIAYAAYLAGQTGLPVLACGGMSAVVENSEAYAMAETLRRWGVRQVWMEARSRDTWENAQFARQTLDQRNLSRALLVTNAQHARRAESAFGKAGMNVLSAPTEFRMWGPWERGLLLLVPTHRHFDESCYAFRVWMGEAWYWLRGR